MPVFKSDRISVVQRKNKENYRHNLRRIKASLPPEPWPKLDRVTILLPVDRWDEALNQLVKDIYDGLSHPFRLTLIDNGTGLSESQCRKSLGRLSELGNLTIVHSAQKLTNVAPYRFAAKQIKADWVFLATKNFPAQSHVPAYHRRPGAP